MAIIQKKGEIKKGEFKLMKEKQKKRKTQKKGEIKVGEKERDDVSGQWVPLKKNKTKTINLNLFRKKGRENKKK